MKANKEIIMNAVSNLGFEVFRNGQFHWNSSNTPDMVINNDGTIHCWTSSPFKNNTSNHGDLIDFLQMTNINQSYKEAKQEAERLTGLTLPDINKYKDNGYTVDNSNIKTGYISEEFIKTFDTARKDNFSRYKELLNEALPSLDFEKQKEIAIKYQIGYIEQSDRLSMPIRDEENRIVTLWKYNKNPNNYINDKGLEVIPGKVLFTKGRERSPFNLYDLQEYRKDINQEVYLCGGEKDTLNMIGNGHRAITLGSENENLKEKYKPLFQDLKIVIAYDNDDAGQKGAEKILKQLQCVAKEIKVWNWNKVQKNQDLTLFKGFDMTDYLSVIKKQNLEFDKTNYKNEKKDVEMKAEEFKKFRENTEKKFGISFEDVRNSDDSELKSKWLDEYNNQKENRPKKELLQKTTQNKIRLTVAEKQMQKYKEFLDSVRYKKENESDFKINPKIFKDIYDKDLSIDEKIDLTTTKVDELKEESKNIGEKIKDYSESKMVDKSELFRTLEKEIHEFSSMIEFLKNENRELRRELELLIQKDEKEKEQKSLEKENKNLQEKIENLKNKKTTSKEQAPEKINKISYEKTQVQEM
ncbi:toprim domain-containing protein [Aliarcobacter butzleri]|uniref:toprim domain-containing protein n=1 Tax=Aliarcobacter butzleri TaxID=28197 RepID=UPI001EDB6565|nr:toprim domain-containing protein [Aliarcobacter butzleri]MCG3710377.1 toprim domain-containing protein [Aliarcobacter butzleri]MCT7549070.1 toprim domain-containing protein [Aliarcobacter butzleri]MCT7558380.1 toprim domain-containing protein [Aliarcobacter butzleri]MCT7610603.1 toprim domain-containing protein [Aliarcobacter butzleri]